MYLLKYRSRGKSVQLLQELLNDFGHELDTDGYFSRMTEAAVKDFQQVQNLTADGIVYTQTWAKLLLLPPLTIPTKTLSNQEIETISKRVLKKDATDKKAIKVLQELLNQLGETLVVDGDFGRGTDRAVKAFQRNNNLTVDGIIGAKTWAKLFAQATITINEKDLSNKDIIKFADDFNLEVAVVQAVQEVESSGKGFLKDGRPTILFEGHIFWRELKEAKINPQPLVAGNENVLYPKWVTGFYKGGAAEYTRLEKARNITKQAKLFEAALSACSWGMFQIMGFNLHKGGAFDVIDFVTKMKRSEGEQLKSFGHFIESTNLLVPLRKKQWAKFAKGYNGSGYKANKYDEKLENAYLKYSAIPLLG